MRHHVTAHWVQAIPRQSKHDVKLRPSWLDGFINSESYWKSASNWPEPAAIYTGMIIPNIWKKCSRPPTSIPCWLPASLTNPLSQDQIVIKRWCKLQLPGWMLAFDLRSWPIMWIYPLVSIIFWGGSFYIFAPQSQVAVGQRIGVGAIILQLVRWEPQRNTRQQLLWQISANYDNA